MKIFLDIDGVFVHANPSIALEFLSDGFYKFNDESIKAFNQLITKFPYEIILSTTHRFNHTKEEWISIFQTRGVNIDELTIMDSPIDGQNKKSQVYQYIVKNRLNTNDILIIDDDKSFNDVSINKIQPNPIYGLRLIDIN
jgi:hypothetical protein